MNNPYAWNSVNPQICYGRDLLLSELLSGLPGSPRYSFGIAGGRRMGKSTLLRRLEQELRTSIGQWKQGGFLVIPVYVDGLSLLQPLSIDDVWTYVLNEVLAACFGSDHKSVQATDFADFKKAVEAVLSQINQQARIIVLFDEIEPIIVHTWSQSFLGQWRALLSNTPNLSENFTAVFAGAREMAVLQRDIGSPLRDILEWRSLRVLDYSDACRLAQEPIQREWPVEFLEGAYRQTGGHPMLLQYIMQDVCRVPCEEPLEALHRATRKFGRERRWQFAEWWERFVTPTARRVYVRLANNRQPTPLRILAQEFGLYDANEALEILLHVGLISEVDDGFAFRYSSDMFHQWYETYGALGEAPHHDPEIQSRLVKISSAISDKYISAWRIFQSDIPNYSGVLVELRGVLEMLVDMYAPEEIVQAQAGFSLETAQNRPTLRQRIRYMTRQHYSRERTKEIVSDYNLFEINCESLAGLSTMAHRTASGMAHDTATREMAYKALKQWDSILAQLVPSSVE